MRKIYILIVLLCVTVTYAQIDTTDFYKRINKQYFYLSDTDLKNLSAWITSDYFFENSQRIYAKEVYPIEIIWINPDRLFFIRRPLPNVQDSLLNIMKNLQTNLQRELNPIFTDWQKVYSNFLFKNLLPDHNFYIQNDTIYITFKADNTDSEIYSTLSFNYNGRCLNIITYDRIKKQRILIYPTYISEGNKWICSEWLTQITEEGEIKSIYKVKMEHKLIANIYFPEKIVMMLLTTDKTKVISERVYYLRNIRLDRDLKILN